MDPGEGTGTLRFLIHDRDLVFTTASGEVVKAAGLRVITIAPKTPRMNAICERVNGTLRTSPGSSGPWTYRRSPPGTWPACCPSAENPAPPE